MARSKKGTKLCKSNTARKALTVGDKSDAGSSHGFGLMLNIASGVWDTEFQQNSTVVTKSFCYCVPNSEQGLSSQLLL